MPVPVLRQSFATFALFSLMLLPSFAQTPATVRGTGVITGRVTLGEKPAANVLVGLVRAEPSGPTTGGALLKDTTDNEGRFRLEHVPAGNVRVTPLAPGYVVAGDSPGFYEQGKTVQLREAETVEGLEFKLTRGGVITGKVTDTAGKPLIEQRLQVWKLEPGGRKTAWSSAGLSYLMMQTDDRGVYRLFGLPEGRYLISAGKGPGELNPVRGLNYKRTFYPDVTEENLAKPVEVTPGFEAKDIDIRLAPETVKGHSVVVRVVDAETVAPLPGVSIGYGPYQGTRLTSVYIMTTDGQGMARFDGLLPGRYGVQLRSSDTPSEYFSDAVTFEVFDSDLEGVEVRAQRGAVITGRAVLEGAVDPMLQARLAELRLYAFSRPATTDGRPGAPMQITSSTVKLNADGSFRTSGLAPGKVQFNVSVMPGQSNLSGFTLLRLEYEGVPQKDGIEVSAGQQVANVRLVFGYGQTTVRGQVQIVNGTLPEGARVSVTLRRADGQNYGYKGAQVDVRGRFTIEGVLAGEYELLLNASPRMIVAHGPDGNFGTSNAPTPGLPRTIKQKLVVPPAGEVPVNLTLDLATPQER
jgi:hypothetical protein